jgi:hypothetical protein
MRWFIDRHRNGGHACARGFQNGGGRHNGWIYTRSIRLRFKRLRRSGVGRVAVRYGPHLSLSLKRCAENPNQMQDGFSRGFWRLDKKILSVRT